MGAVEITLIVAAVITVIAIVLAVIRYKLKPKRNCGSGGCGSCPYHGKCPSTIGKLPSAKGADKEEPKRDDSNED